MAMVLYSMGVPPAARTPSATFTASSRRWKLQGMVPIQVLAIPMMGLFSSASVYPMAFRYEQSGARARPVRYNGSRCSPRQRSAWTARISSSPTLPTRTMRPATG